ncbi:retrovirus-related pol polyprotein from transposon TNT 1-94 [Tanacetum coccineum]
MPGTVSQVFHILCFSLLHCQRDGENLDKMKEKESTSIEHSFNTSKLQLKYHCHCTENHYSSRTNTEKAQFDDDEFINIYQYTGTKKRGEQRLVMLIRQTSIFYQTSSFTQRWTKRSSIRTMSLEILLNQCKQESVETDGEMLALEKQVMRKITVHSNKSVFWLRGYAQKEGIDFKESFAQLLGRRVRKHQMDLLTHIHPEKFTRLKESIIWSQTRTKSVVDALSNFWYRRILKSLTVYWSLRRLNMGLWYPKDTGFELTAFSDSDHAGCLDSRKSTSGGIQFLGGDKLVSWSSKKQDCTSMSIAEAEYVSLSACCAQVLWLRTQLTDYGFHFDKIPMYCDSKAAIAISCNPVQHSHTKHIDVRYHFIKEQVENGIVELFFVGTEYQLADLFTKALSEDRFKYLVRRLGMRCLTPDELKRAINVAGARENVGTPVVQKSGIQCYNCKEYGHVSRECQKPKRVKDAAYHKEKMLLCKQEEAGVHNNDKTTVLQPHSSEVRFINHMLLLKLSKAQVDQGSQIKMIQVKEMMQDNDLKNSKSKDKGSKSRSQSMDEQSHYKQDKTITRQSINIKRHIFNVIGDTEKFEERDLNIGGDC